LVISEEWSMALPRTPALVMPIVAITVGDGTGLDEVERECVNLWGELLGRSSDYEFDPFTRYYESEMGTGLTKRIIAHVQPMDMGEIVARKHRANDLERRWLDAVGNRMANIDPGYLTPGALVLASAKPSPHRVYVGDGIYAEATLIYEASAYEPHRWTYPDFGSGVVREALGSWRAHSISLAGTGPASDSPT